MSFAQTERNRLAQLLIDEGPDAPTLCEGWTTRDLAEHLYMRENRPVAFLPGIGNRARKFVTERDYEALVKAWAAGPPAPIKPVDSLLNTAENFVHHEDVRRGDGEARVRDFSKQIDKELMRCVARFGRVLLSKSAVPVILSPTSLPPVTVGDKRGVTERGDNVVRVVGEPGELLLWVFGRDAVDVTVSGDPECIAVSRLNA
ncbi:TIGR03085 family metal-binding protein [Corynebacterium breve]|uniref:TIGR03085 family metal-binding protein n=1 Tax=Corynebacterium breve TaxID=3049799 RepID=A0ABY8VH08_9CORY|nr:TIGR03085 family metal-binding protein [Corynebacterium breve]WIM66815.1 TIGR03085 family metal-binding protein [Corynebacterium breve]